MNDYEASIEEAYQRGVEAGRADTVPPGVVPLPWCEPHNSPIEPFRRVCVRGLIQHLKGNLPGCYHEVKVAHWVTVKEETT